MQYFPGDTIQLIIRSNRPGLPMTEMDGIYFTQATGDGLHESQKTRGQAI